MDTNFKYLFCGRSADGDKLLVDVYIILKDPSKQESLAAALNKDNLTVVNDLSYSFVVDVAPAQFQEPGQAEPTLMQAVKISFEAADIEVLLPFITRQMAQQNYYLDAPEFNIIRRACFVGGEQQYLQRVIALIPALLDSQKPLISFEYNNIVQIAMEIPEILRQSFVAKLAAKFKYHGLNQCAQAVIALYQELKLAQPAAPIEKPLCEVLRTAATQQIARVGRIDAKSNDDRKTLFIVLDDKEYETLLKARLDNDHVLQVANKSYEFSITKGITKNEPKVDSLILAFPTEHRFLLLDFMYMQLEKYGYFLDANLRRSIREGLGFDEPEHYRKFAGGIVEMITAKSDDPALLEFNWLARMAFEITPALRDTFIFDVACMLNTNGLNNCALALSISYRDSKSCKELQSLVEQLQKIIELGNGQKLLFSALPKTSTDSIADVPLATEQAVEAAKNILLV